MTVNVNITRSVRSLTSQQSIRKMSASNTAFPHASAKHASVITPASHPASFLLQSPGVVITAGNNAKNATVKPRQLIGDQAARIEALLGKAEAALKELGVCRDALRGYSFASNINRIYFNDVYQYPPLFCLFTYGINSVYRARAMPDHYRTLGVPRTATDDEIKKACVLTACGRLLSQHVRVQIPQGSNEVSS